MDLRSYVKLLLRRWPVFVVTVIVVGGAIGGASFFIPPVYSATSTLTFAPVLGSETTIDERRSSTFYVVERMATYAQTVSTTEILDPVIDEERLDTTAQKLADEIIVTVPSGTTLLSITAEGDTARGAASLANAIAARVPDAVAALEGVATTEASPVTVATFQAAEPPENRSSPNHRLNLAIAAVVALFLGVLFAVLADSFDTRVRRAKDLEALGLPYLGAVQLARGTEATTLLNFAAQPIDRKMAIRRIAIDVLFAADRSPAHVLVTSALPGAGKTTVAAGIASALSEAGNRVVYIDTDMRGGRLAAQLRLPQLLGVTDIVAGKADLDDVLQQWPVGGFTILPIGATAVGVSDLLGSDAFSLVLTALDERFDVIVIDAPPVTNTAEAARFTQNVHEIVVVAEAAETKRTDLVRATTSLQHAGAEIVGIVLNRTTRADDAAASPADTVAAQPQGAAAP
ncbi:MAG TPA: hypothetical protein DHW40_12385 [Microbacterium sp.]|nr:hypothetical protein [Microbacterium sp.]